MTNGLSISTVERANSAARSQPLRTIPDAGAAGRGRKAGRGLSGHGAARRPGNPASAQPEVDRGELRRMLLDALPQDVVR